MAKGRRRRGRTRSSRPRRTLRARLTGPESRRSLVLIGGSVALSAIVLAAWFPASSLLHQRQALAATTSSLNQLRQQDQALAKERARLADPSEIERIARQQYQLVIPGEQPYEVLPRNDAGSNYPGDPANQPLVAPNANGELPSGTQGTTSAPAASASKPKAHTHPSSSPGLLTRIARTLEFWR